MLAIAAAPVFAGDKDEVPASKIHYRWGRAYHIPPETTTDESGYYSLVEGLNGRIYVGTAAYGRNAYLVEFDPASEKMRVVLDAHKVIGLPLEPTGYAAQAKIHTRNFVGRSGKIYVGTKQGYPTDKDKAEGVVYPGGYLLTYDPKTELTENLGQPMPWSEKLRAMGYHEGEGVIDVAADESRELLYVVTCEHQHWLVYDMKTGRFTEPDPDLRLVPYAMTVIAADGRAYAITSDFRLAQYDPRDGRVRRLDMAFPADREAEVLTTIITPDGRSIYFLFMNRPNLFRVDLPFSEPGEADPARVAVSDLGPMIKGTGHDSRCALALGPDGRVYAVIRIDNNTGFGTGFLHHLLRYDPQSGRHQDLGVLAVENPDFYGLPLGAGGAIDPASGKPRPWTHGYHRLPDGTLTPLHAHMAMTVASDGRIYVTVLYPFTLLCVEPIQFR